MSTYTIFTPDHYFSTLGTHPPVLHVADGDTVVTTTIDAGGFDARRERVHVGVNPMTGPFFVEGAEPGDTLAVRLDRLRPNRRFGWSGVQLASNVMDPADVALLPPPPGFAEGSGEWDVDMDAGTATLVSPETRLGRLAIPVRPMVGCFGVAPPGGRGPLHGHVVHQRRQHGLQGLRGGRHRVLPRRRPRRAVLPRRRPCPAGLRRGVRDRHRDLVRCAGHAVRPQGQDHPVAPRRDGDPHRHRSATPGHWTRRCSTPPARWRGGCKTTTGWTGWGRTR